MQPTGIYMGSGVGDGVGGGVGFLVGDFVAKARLTVFRVDRFVVTQAARQEGWRIDGVVFVE